MKESFILYLDSLEVLDILDDEQAGLLFKAIYAYQSGDMEKLQQICKSDQSVFVAFIQFERYFKRDNERYQDTCNKRSEAGKAGAQKRWEMANDSKNSKCHSSDSKNSKCHFSHDSKMANDSKRCMIIDNDTDIKEKDTHTINSVRIEKESAATAVAPTRAQTRYERFLDWLKAECPYIAAHYKLPSEELFTKLLDKYGGEAIAEQCANIENRADIRKRYTNLYQTLNNWLKRETNGNNKDDNAESSREQRAAAVADLITRLRAEDARAG